MDWIKTKDQVSLAVYDLAPENEKTIVMVHGWPLDHRMFEYQVNLLPQYGYRVILLDLRGFGASDRPWQGYDYNQLADDLADIIQAKKLNHFTLLGFSMGGAIVTRYMSRHQAFGVDKLVLLSAAVPRFTKTEQVPYAAYSVRDVNALVEQFLQDRPKTLQDFGNQFFFQKRSIPFLNWFQALTETASSYATIKTLLSLRNEDLTDDLKTIQVPTAIFHAEEDQICPFPLAIATKRLVPQAELHPFAGCGHGLFFEEVDRFTQELIQFIES